MMDDGFAFSLISLFRCGDTVGLDLGLADMCIRSLMFAWWLMAIFFVEEKMTCFLRILFFWFS